MIAASEINQIREALVRSASPRLRAWCKDHEILPRAAMKALAMRDRWRNLATELVEDLRKQGIDLSEDLAGLPPEDAAETIYWRIMEQHGDRIRRYGYEERVYAVPYIQAWLAVNSDAVKPHGGASIWTNAPRTYDAASTVRTGEIYNWMIDSGRPTRLERVYIRPDNLQWQLDRYLSGMIYAAMDDERLAKEQEYDRKRARMAEFASIIRGLRESKGELKFLPPDELERRLQALRSLPKDVQDEEWRLDRELREALSASKEMARYVAEQKKEEDRITAALRDILTPPGPGMVFAKGSPSNWGFHVDRVLGTVEKGAGGRYDHVRFSSKQSIFTDDILRNSNQYRWVKDPVPHGTPQAVWDAGAQPDTLHVEQVDGKLYYVWRLPGSFNPNVVNENGRKVSTTSQAYKTIRERSWK